MTYSLWSKRADARYAVREGFHPSLDFLTQQGAALLFSLPKGSEVWIEEEEEA